MAHRLHGIDGGKGDGARAIGYVVAEGERTAAGEWVGVEDGLGVVGRADLRGDHLGHHITAVRVGLDGDHHRHPQCVHVRLPREGLRQNVRLVSVRLYRLRFRLVDADFVVHVLLFFRVRQRHHYGNVRKSARIVSNLKEQSPTRYILRGAFHSRFKSGPPLFQRGRGRIERIGVVRTTTAQSWGRIGRFPVFASCIITF